MDNLTDRIPPVRVTPELKEQLEILASRKHIKLSQLVRIVLHGYCNGEADATKSEGSKRAVCQNKADLGQDEME